MRLLFKVLGWGLILFGLAALLVHCNMDTSVPTSDGGRVHNIGLIADRDMKVMVSGGVMLTGFVVILLAMNGGGSRESRDGRKRIACPSCAELVLAEAQSCRYCGVALPGLALPAAVSLVAAAASARNGSSPNEWAENKGFIAVCLVLLLALVGLRYL